MRGLLLRVMGGESIKGRVDQSCDEECDCDGS